jgi:hypothetical protein
MTEVQKMRGEKIYECDFISLQRSDHHGDGMRPDLLPRPQGEPQLCLRGPGFVFATSTQCSSLHARRSTSVGEC